MKWNAALLRFREKKIHLLTVWTNDGSFVLSAITLREWGWGTEEYTLSLKNLLPVKTKNFISATGWNSMCWTCHLFLALFSQIREKNREFLFQLLFSQNWPWIYVPCILFQGNLESSYVKSVLDIYELVLQTSPNYKNDSADKVKQEVLRGLGNIC